MYIFNSISICFLVQINLLRSRIQDLHSCCIVRIDFLWPAISLTLFTFLPKQVGEIYIQQFFRLSNMCQIAFRIFAGQPHHHQLPSKNLRILVPLFTKHLSVKRLGIRLNQFPQKSMAKLPLNILKTRRATYVVATNKGEGRDL